MNGSGARCAAVLGAGIMGCATALFLARKGFAVTLFDAGSAPFCGASRWNEGKIHLGYLYAGDATLATARQVLPGGLAFKDLTETLIGCSISPATGVCEETYLIHRNSVASADATGAYFEAVARLARNHPQADRYLVDLRKCGVRRLSETEIDQHYDGRDIACGFRVPEHSVSTMWIADRFVEAVFAEPGIEVSMNTEVRGVEAIDDAFAGPLFVDTSQGRHGPFAQVVNALWQGRLAIDAKLGMLPTRPWSHRFRLSVFLRTRTEIAAPSAVVATGPFGDVKNYNGRDFYLSWYPVGLILESGDIAPPSPRTLTLGERKRIVDDVFLNLGGMIHAVGDLEASAETIRLEGGWVYAIGRGSLADPTSLLHRRDCIGVRRKGAYLSVDTGKYSIAPWLAKQIADAIADG